MIYKTKEVPASTRNAMRKDYEGKTSGNSMSLKEIGAKYDVFSGTVHKIAHEDGWEVRRRGYAIRNSQMMFMPTKTSTKWADGFQSSASSTKKTAKRAKPKSTIVTLNRNNSIQASKLPEGLNDALVLTLYRNGQLFQAA